MKTKQERENEFQKKLEELMKEYNVDLNVQQKIVITAKEVSVEEKVA